MSTSPRQPALATPGSTRRLTAPGQRWFVLALLLLFVVLGVRYSFKVLDERSAFRRWQPQVLDLERGIDISQRHAYPNPPIMAVLLEPLCRLPPLAGALTWFFLKVGMALLALHWAFRLVEEPQRPFPPWARALVVGLSLKPIIDDLNHGNVNLFILFLIVAALTLFRRGRDLLAGVVLGLAVACKVTPGLFLPYLLWKRAWRALAGCALGLVLFLYPGVVPGLRLGFHENAQQLASWYQLMVHPFVVEGKVTSDHHNQSLPGLVARLATHNPSFSTYVNNVYTPTRYDNLLDLTPTQARWLVKGCMALFALLIVCCCRTPVPPWDCRVRIAECGVKNGEKRSGLGECPGPPASSPGNPQSQGWRLAAEFSIVVLGMLLFSERTWKHHAVTLVLPFAVLCYHLAVCRPSPALRRYLAGSLALVVLLLAVPGLAPAKERLSSPTGAYTSLAKQAEVYGAYLFAHLVLLAALVVLLCQGQGRAAAGGGALPPARAA
jgi:hypothetical protein